MEATSREAAPAKSSASGPSAPPALFELCGRAVSAHMGVLESGVWGKSRGEGLPLATSGGGPAAGGRGGRGREARGKAQPRALEDRPWSGSVNSLTERAEQSKDRAQTGRWTRTKAWLGVAGGEARRPGLGRSRPGPDYRSWTDGLGRGHPTDTRAGRGWGVSDVERTGKDVPAVWGRGPRLRGPA